MPSLQQIRAMVGPEWKHAPIPGFHGFTRVHPDGRLQLLRIFTWSNAKHAAQQGIPRAYLVICYGLDSALVEDGRFRLPLVEWPSTDQPRRPWPEVVAEFRAVFQTFMDLPLPQAQAAAGAVPERYQLLR